MEIKVKILDCTLRDGGYYNNWDFSKEIVDVYCEFIENSPIDYVEVGYRSIPLDGYLGEYFYCPTYVLKYLKSKMPSKDLVIILNEKDIREGHVTELLSPCLEYISMVRLAIDPVNFKRAVVLAKKIKSLGFKVAFNVMYMSKWKEENSFLEDLRDVEKFVDYFYMVDSFGGVVTADIKDTVSLIKKNSQKLKIGFHGHNNLQMAMANTLESIEQGCSIVDATITGMGRGAGNLRTELLLTYFESLKHFELDYFALGRVVSEFEKLKEHYKWGTNLPYMFSGAHSLPQKQVMEWVGLNRYPISSILNALKNRKELRKDNIKLDVLEIKKSFRKALILGGGKSVKHHKTAIEKLLESHPEMCLIHAGSRNVERFLEVKNEQYYALVGSENEKLTNSVKDPSSLTGVRVYPPYPREMGTQIPDVLLKNAFELSSISFTDASKDSPLALSVQIALDIGAEELYFAGFDGYKNEVNNIQLIITQENQRILDDLYLNKDLKIKFITPSRYKGISMESIYSYLN